MQNYKYEKIFVIGFNKCGTTSFYDLFVGANLKAVHGWRGRENKCARNERFNYMKIINKYDAFTDGFHSINKIKKYYSFCRNSLFILNTRSISNWLISRYKHGSIYNFKKSWCWPPSEEEILKLVDKREKHYRNVLNFFKNKSYNLIIIDIEKNGWQSFVLKKLGIKEPNNINIHSNMLKNELIDKNKIKLIQEIVFKTLISFNYPINENFLKNVFIQNYPYEHNFF
jgi:hypothetical protein